MNSQNIASLAEELERLGFDASLNTSIYTYISLQLPKFSISYKTVKERDVLRFNLLFERKDNAYSCLCYDAILRKEIVIPDAVINGIHLNKMDQEMKLINWDTIFIEEQNIETIISDLQLLSSSKEGKEFADQLKVKYWSDTPLENIMGISFVKSRYEIAQRFYFLNDGKGISIEEAYRFLNNKWMEKQLRKRPPLVAQETRPAIKTKSKKTKTTS